MLMKKSLVIPFSWEERRHVFLEQFFYIPKNYDSARKGERIDWANPLVFGNSHPVSIEFCSGNGQWIINQAKAHPDCNWLAVEIQFCRARQIWEAVQREKLTNLYVVCGEALDFLRHYVPEKCIYQSFVNFPDPWPKRHHAPRRLVQAPFCSLLQKTMVACAPITLVTDSAPYRDQMTQVFRGWQSRLEAPFYCTDLPQYGESFFANLWKGKGREIFYMQYLNEMD